MENLRAKDYRLAASEQCSNYSSTLAITYLVYSLVLGALSAASFAILGILISGPLMMGIVNLCEEVYKKGNVNVETLFSGFKLFEKSFILALLSDLYLFLWSLLIIPAFIKPFSYAMSFYIQKDNPNMSANECITESRRIMNGNKWKLFCLLFSYIGWIILCILTFGILSFWVTPKIQQAKYLFYLHITGKDQVVAEEN